MFAIQDAPLSLAALGQRWRDLAPVMPEEGRAELDPYGELILSPLPTNRHQRIAGWSTLTLKRRGSVKSGVRGRLP